MTTTTPNWFELMMDENFSFICDIHREIHCGEMWEAYFTNTEGEKLDSRMMKLWDLLEDLDQENPIVKGLLVILTIGYDRETGEEISDDFIITMGEIPEEIENDDNYITRALPILREIEESVDDCLENRFTTDGLGANAGFLNDEQMKDWKALLYVRQLIDNAKLHEALRKLSEQFDEETGEFIYEEDN